MVTQAIKGQSAGCELGWRPSDICKRVVERYEDKDELLYAGLVIGYICAKTREALGK